MEDYKQKYEEAMLRMNKWVEGSEITDPKEVAEFVFPELKESEDERIKKAVIEFVIQNKSFTHCKGVSKDDCIAWLEKQQGKKDWGLDEEKMLDDIFVAIHLDTAFSETYRNKLINFLKTYRPYFQYENIEKQGEQKEINLVEILKHYPRETELYSPLYGKLWLAEVDKEHEIITCYKHQLESGCTRAVLEQEDTVSFYSNGTTGLPDFTVSKDCMLFLYNTKKQGEQKPTYGDRELPQLAKVKSTGKVVNITDGQLSTDGKTWIKYSSDMEDGFKVYKPEELSFLSDEQKPSPTLTWKHWKDGIGVTNRVFSTLQTFHM